MPAQDLGVSSLVLLLSLLTSAGCDEAATTPQATDGGDVSGSITGLTFDPATHRRTAVDSDNWPSTWSDDGHLYTIWGDGFGWEEDGSKASFGVTRISGAHDSYTGTDRCGDPGTVGGCAADGSGLDGKAYGILSLDGVLYAFVSAGSNTQAYPGADLYKSTDKGASWTQTGVRINGTDDTSENIVHPVFLQFGQDYANARDSYVYVYGADIKDTSGLVIQDPGDIWLLRVHSDSLEDKSAYQWYASTDPAAPSWGTKTERQPVFEDPDGVSWTTGSIVWVPGLDQYVLATEHTSSGAGNLQVHVAPEPWGPWTEIHRELNWPPGDQVEATTFFWNFSPKWFRNGGQDFTLIFSGFNSNDSWNTVDGKFELAVP